jgi:hypothetical protein
MPEGAGQGGSGLENAAGITTLTGTGSVDFRP